MLLGEVGAAIWGDFAPNVQTGNPWVLGRRARKQRIGVVGLLASKDVAVNVLDVTRWCLASEWSTLNSLRVLNSLRTAYRLKIRIVTA